VILREKACLPAGRREKPAQTVVSGGEGGGY